MRQLETVSIPGFMLVPANAPNLAVFMPPGRGAMAPGAGTVDRDWPGQDQVAIPSDRGPGLLPWQTKRVHDYVDAELHGRTSLNVAAGHARLSPGYFSRCFRRTFGVTFSRFVASRRIERAQDLIMQGGGKLCQIALACGFADQAHFTRIFGGFVGCSPARWRRQFAPPGAALEI
jgi:transcriptional regulator GlxA family with amidase domain